MTQSRERGLQGADLDAAETNALAELTVRLGNIIIVQVPEASQTLFIPGPGVVEVTSKIANAKNLFLGD
jgi:hypothetical protein